MNSHTVTVVIDAEPRLVFEYSGHLPMVSHPDDVVHLIQAAAQAVGSGTADETVTTGV